MLSIIFKFLKILNSETEPGQISLALCLSMITGFTPLLSPHNLFILLLILILRVNISSFILGWVIFSGIAYILDPLFHWTGYALLTSKSLQTVWTSLYNTILFRFENLNNSIAMGSLVISLILFIPVYILIKILIKQYRDSVLDWLRRTRLIQAIKATKFYTAYQTVSGLRG